MREDSRWDLALTDRERAQALCIARHIGDSLADAERFRTTAVAAAHAYGLDPTWQPASFVSGYAGTAAFFAALAHAADGEQERRAWAQLMHRDLSAALAAEALPGTDVFGGLAGVAAAALYARECTGAYESLHRSLQQALRDRLRSAPALPFELGYGLAGAVLALESDVPMEAIAALAMPFCDPTGRAWRSAIAFASCDSSNVLGMAHGAAGAIAALATLVSSAPAVTEAIETACAFEMARVDDSAPIARWPLYVDGSRGEFGTQAWCHGAPGILVALYAGARASANAAHRRYALEHLRRWRDAGASDITHHTMFCHGAAGLVALFGAVAHAEGDPLLSAIARRIFRVVLERYDAGALYGYRAHAPECLVDDGTLLMGSAGIGLVLLTAAGYSSASWLTALGIPAVARSAEILTHQS